MYASLVTGSESHKKIDPNAPYLLRLYYQSKVVLFLVCMLDQWFYIGVYLLTWKDPTTGDLLFLSSNPETGVFSIFLNESIGFILRSTFLPFVGTPLVEVAIILLEETGTIRMIIWIVSTVSGVVCLLKQILNIIQLVGAAKDLAAFDVKSRAKGKRKQKN
ncbi:UNVERIFIED_CONTAM: CDP-diacylglycerol-inositol 3-phosphatidyltransferase [Siphonaria sp. JEL0065]|nr:CDP-diacylglycerol-inositol 3-phosphatidyltransferase [Siphonaria sp. JEL0065]